MEVTTIATVAIGLVLQPTALVAAQGSPTPVSFSGVPCMCFAGLYAAWAAGPFQRQGLVVEKYLSTGGGSYAFQALLAGDVDLYVSALVEVLRGRGQGRPVRIVGVLYPEIWALVVRNDLKDRVQQIADLRGTKIGVTSIGSGTWAFANAVVRSAGLEPQRDVTILPLGGLSSIVAGLKSGRVDAAVVWPGASPAVVAGAGFPLVDLLVREDHIKTLGVPVSLSQVVAAREETIERQPDLVRRVMAALNEGYLWVRKQPAEQVAAIVARYVGLGSPSAVLPAVQESLPMHPSSPAISRRAYQVSHDLLVQAGVLEKPVAFDSVVDCRFAGCEP